VGLISALYPVFKFAITFRQSLGDDTRAAWHSNRPLKKNSFASMEFVHVPRDSWHHTMKARDTIKTRRVSKRRSQRETRQGGPLRQPHTELDKFHAPTFQHRDEQSTL
jgi:hypothetical protein